MFSIKGMRIRCELAEVSFKEQGSLNKTKQIKKENAITLEKEFMVNISLEEFDLFLLTVTYRFQMEEIQKHCYPTQYNRRGISNLV